MTQEEVTDLFGEPPIAFATGPENEYYCLTYSQLPDPLIPQKRGEYVGFQVMLRSNKLEQWSLVLSASDPP